MAWILYKTPRIFVFSFMGIEFSCPTCPLNALTAESFWGNPDHLKVMDESLVVKRPKLHTLVAKSNSGNFTYDGIELGGERVCQEIEEEIEKLARAGQAVTRLSLVGYSLGGLVARYAIGLLYSKGLFRNIQPVVSATKFPLVVQQS